jgi:hypothetical protein
MRSYTWAERAASIGCKSFQLTLTLPTGTSCLFFNDSASQTGFLLCNATFLFGSSGLHSFRWVTDLSSQQFNPKYDGVPTTFGFPELEAEGQRNYLLPGNVIALERFLLDLNDHHRLIAFIFPTYYCWFDITSLVCASRVSEISLNLAISRFSFPYAR